MKAKILTIGELLKSSVAAGFPQGFMKDKIADPEKSHPFVGQEKPSETLANRGYPDAASQKTTERAIKEVTTGKSVRATLPHKVIEPLDINSKRWNEIKAEIESAKERYGIDVENKLRKKTKEIGEGAKNPDPNELNAWMRVLKDQGFYGLASEVDQQGRGLFGSQWARMYYVNTNKGECVMEDKKMAKTLIVDPVNLFVRVVDVPAEVLEKAGGPPGPGLVPKKVPVKSQKGTYQAVRYTGTGQQPAPGAGKPGAPGGVQQESQGPNTVDQPAKEGDHILIEGRHAMVASAGKHGVTAHEADGTQHQKFHGDYAHFNEKPEAGEEGAKFDFGEKSPEDKAEQQKGDKQKEKEKAEKNKKAGADHVVNVDSVMQWAGDMDSESFVQLAENFGIKRAAKMDEKDLEAKLKSKLEKHPKKAARAAQMIYDSMIEDYHSTKGEKRSMKEFLDKEYDHIPEGLRKRAIEEFGGNSKPKEAKKVEKKEPEEKGEKKGDKPFGFKTHFKPKDKAVKKSLNRPAPDALFVLEDW